MLLRELSPETAEGDVSGWSQLVFGLLKPDVDQILVA